MIRSMTGFARVNGALSGRLAVGVTLRSVNHRYLEVSVKLPESLWECEPRIRGLASERVSRGKLDVLIRAQRSEPAVVEVSVNEAVAKTAIPRLREIVAELGIDTSLSASDLLRIPDFLTVQTVDSELEDDERAKLETLVGKALDALTAMREAEGAALRRDLENRLDVIASLHARLVGQVDDLRAELATQLRQRVTEIAATLETTVSEDRIAQEIAFAAERGDVAEELTRLGVHIEQVRRVIEHEKAPGKKLDFLAQEMLREVNTLGQKSRSATIRSAVVECRTEIERIREQVQNVE